MKTLKQIRESTQLIFEASGLIIARKLPDGSVKYGQPGMIHSHLVDDDELDRYSPEIEKSMGFAEPGGAWMSRADAAKWVKIHEPHIYKHLTGFDKNDLESVKYRWTHEGRHLRETAQFDYHEIAGGRPAVRYKGRVLIGNGQDIHYDLIDKFQKKHKLSDAKVDKELELNRMSLGHHNIHTKETWWEPANPMQMMQIERGDKLHEHWLHNPDLAAAVRYKGEVFHGRPYKFASEPEHHADLLEKIKKQHKLSNDDIDAAFEKGHIHFGDYNHKTKKADFNNPDYTGWNDVRHDFKISDYLEEAVILESGLVVARKLKHGKVLYGQPGQHHADLVRDYEDIGYIDDNAFGFARPGGKFMSRKEAAEWVKKREPEIHKEIGKEIEPGKKTNSWQRKLEAYTYNQAHKNIKEAPEPVKHVFSRSDYYPVVSWNGKSYTAKNPKTFHYGVLNKLMSTYKIPHEDMDDAISKGEVKFGYKHIKTGAVHWDHMMNEAWLPPHLQKAVKFKGKLYLEKQGETHHSDILARVMKQHNMVHPEGDEAIESGRMKLGHYDPKTKKFGSIGTIWDDGGIFKPIVNENKETYDTTCDYCEKPYSSRVKHSKSSGYYLTCPHCHSTQVGQYSGAPDASWLEKIRKIIKK